MNYYTYIYDITYIMINKYNAIMKSVNNYYCVHCTLSSLRIIRVPNYVNSIYYKYLYQYQYHVKS